MMNDDDYRLLQVMLAANPRAGVVIKNSGGIRKIRWVNGKHGKRGGYRVMYHHSEKLNQIRMLFLFSKNEQSDLEPGQLKVLRQIVENWQQ
ncbi:MAG: type II toxin-antitoxin system RelE/ParE family toxin [Idiomarina sp.]